ncbi:MAG: helix-turn-helix transcriptional regulator [Gemmataceae bacterium]
MRFGETLRRLRLAGKLSQAELAKRSGLSARNVQNWEQGHRVPRAPSLLALARALGVTVDTLLGDAGEGVPGDGKGA